MTSLTVRLDDEAERALGVLLAKGMTKTEAVKAALLGAEREALRAQVRAECERIMADPDEVAETMRVNAEMDAGRAW